MEKRTKTLRTIRTQARYERHTAFTLPKHCYLCSAPPIRNYKHWKIIENQYPYDEIATMHHMVVSVYHAREAALHNEALEEYARVKNDLHQEYDVILENTHKQKSIPEHHHLHLLRIKERVMTENEKRPRAVFLTPTNHTTNMSAP